MSDEVRRSFLLQATPDLIWIYERRLTVAFWDLGAGWTLRVQQHHTGPGPAAQLSVQADGDAEGALTVPWIPAVPPDPGPEGTLEALLRSNPARSLEKVRRGCMVSGVWWELDEYDGRHSGLVVAHTSAGPLADDRLGVPGWVGREVTGDRAYDDRRLADS